MNYLKYLAVGFVFAGLIIVTAEEGLSQTVGTTSSQQGSFRPEEFTDARFQQYEQQLNAILKTRRDEEKEFVALVVAQVRQGKIPAQIVQTSFHWVYKKRPSTNFPFIYFEKVLRLQAKKIGLGNNLPEFDFSIYQSIDSGFSNPEPRR